MDDDSGRTYYSNEACLGKTYRIGPVTDLRFFFETKIEPGVHGVFCDIFGCLEETQLWGWLRAMSRKENQNNVLDISNYRRSVRCTL